MSRLKIRAYVIRTTRLTESSRVVTLFSDELGKVKAVAKGVDRPKSKLSGTIQIFNLIEAVLYKKESSDLGTLSGAVTSDSFPKIAEDPRKFGFGSAWCEILDRTSHPDHPRPKTFQLTGDLFDIMSRSPKVISGLLFWSALLKMLVIEGYSPEIDKCFVCGKTEISPNTVISLKRGGLICGKCSGDDDTLLKLTPESLELLRKMANEDLIRIAGISIDERSGKKAAEVIQSFATYHLGLPRNLKSFKFLETLAD